MSKLLIPTRAEFRSYCFVVPISSTYCFKFHYKEIEVEVYNDERFILDIKDTKDYLVISNCDRDDATERFNLFRTLINKASNQDKVTVTNSNFQFLKRLQLK